MSDIIDKLVNSGIEIVNKANTINILNEYLRQMRDYKIGNVLKIEYLSDNNFILKKVAEHPPLKTNKLP